MSEEEGQKEVYKWPLDDDTTCMGCAVVLLLLVAVIFALVYFAHMAINHIRGLS